MNIALGALLLTAASCSNVDNDGVNFETDLPNAVYLDGLSSTALTKVTLTDEGASATITPRAANLVKGNTKVVVGVDTAALTKYNQKYGTNYKPLPASYYTLSKTEVDIPAGQITNGSIALNINPLNGPDINSSTKYAIPVKIQHADGLDVLSTSDTQIFALDRILHTTVMRIEDFYLRIPFSPDFMSDTWTLSYGMRIDRNKDNQATVSFGGPNGSMYSRITAGGGLQFKTGGTDDPLAFAKTKIVPNTWYYVTWVYDHQHVKCYINGVLDNEFESSVVNGFTQINVSWGALVGYIRELRLYNTTLSDFQIMDNLYIEDPTNKNLVLYFPLDQANGLNNIATGSPYKAEAMTGNDPYDASAIKYVPWSFPEQ